MLVDSIQVKMRPYVLEDEAAEFVNDRCVKITLRKIDTPRFPKLAVNRDIYLPVEAAEDLERVRQKWIGEVLSNDLLKSAEEDFISFLKRYEHKGNLFLEPEPEKPYFQIFKDMHFDYY